MGSKSQNTDQTATTTKTTVIDRKAVQQRGMQILDSVIVGADEKVVKATIAEAKSALLNLNNANSVTVARLQGLTERLLGMVNKGQASVTRFGQEALEGARKDLRALAESGELIIELSSNTTAQAMNMAAQVASDQAANQRKALEIVAETRTGDYSDNLKTISAQIMIFALVALYIAKGR